VKHIKTHKINPVYLRPGDTFGLHYSYEEPAGVHHDRYLTVDSVDEPMMVDTVIVYKVEGNNQLASGNEFGLKAGRVLVMGEDDGTYKDIPVNPGMKPIVGGRLQK
jgi:hypothetical protein